MKRANKTKRVQKIIMDDGRTQQHMADECDINLIIKRHTPEQLQNIATQNEGRYGDATSLQYHEAQNIITNANTMFEELPSDIRKNFNNDPATFLDFTSDKNNHEEMREMGIMEPLPPVKSTPEEIRIEDEANAKSVESEA